MKLTKQKTKAKPKFSKAHDTAMKKTIAHLKEDNREMKKELKEHKRLIKALERSK